MNEPLLRSKLHFLYCYTWNERTSQAVPRWVQKQKQRISFARIAFSIQGICWWKFVINILCYKFNSVSMETKSLLCDGVEAWAEECRCSMHEHAMHMQFDEFVFL